ncbi:MAG TPA: transcriptional regulator [Methylomirabilota bacterium]|nr:transcriptional regulator [Methylomirabilota bacterium]
MASTAPVFHFADLVLDVPNRQLLRGGRPLDLNSRYFDALVLLVREHGQLVEKDRFFSEVWDDVVVSDSALTQCIKDIRKQLGDDAANPRFIQTVPRYGYRFIGDVEVVRADDAHPVPAGGGLRIASVERLRAAATELVAGTVGGGLAGVFGGLLYGMGLTNSPGEAGLGTASILLVMISLTGFVGVLGGFGVSLGLAAAGYLANRHRVWRIVGAALGGMLVGGITKLLGIDAFNLLFGRTPAGITGGVEGAVLGGALALGAHMGGGFGARSRWRPIAGAAAAGGAAGLLIPLAGGHLMGGSLQLLARSFAASRLQLDALGRFFGELHFGEMTQILLGGIEGLAFSGCVVAAIILARHATSTRR